MEIYLTLIYILTLIYFYRKTRHYKQTLLEQESKLHLYKRKNRDLLHENTLLIQKVDSLA